MVNSTERIDAPSLERRASLAVTSSLEDPAMNEESRGSPDTLSRDDLAAKVTWEGGAFEALRYGLRSEQIESVELADLWRQMEGLYEQISPIAWRIESMLERAA